METMNLTDAMDRAIDQGYEYGDRQPGYLQLAQEAAREKLGRQKHALAQPPTKSGPLVDEVCRVLGWQDIGAIQVWESDQEAYVTGKILTPDEWRSLNAASGQLSDGREIVPVYIPRYL